MIEFVIKLFYHNLFLTSSTDDSCLTGWEQGSHCHKGGRGDMRPLKGHLWSLGNQHSFQGSIFVYPCWENSAGWQCQWAERLCRCSLLCLGNSLGMMATWICHLGLWNCLHTLHCHNSTQSLLRIGIQGGIQVHFQVVQRIWVWKNFK